MINITTRKIGGDVIATLIRDDNATMAIRFNVPERIDGVDLSGLSWAVLIRNAAGGTDVYVPAKAERDGHFITFDWFPGGVATAAVGLTEVMISGTAQADNPPVWQSATYYVRVDEKVDADPAGDDAQKLTELQQLIVFVSGELNGVIEAGRSAREAANRANEAAERAENIAGVAIDGTLTQPGAAADAAVVGRKFDKLSEEKADKKDIPAPYTLPTASAETLGGVRIGKGLQMDGDVLSAVGGGSEGVYELVGEIELKEEVSRIRGEGYNLSKMYVELTVPNDGVNAAGTLFVEGVHAVYATSMKGTAMDATVTKCVARIENGMLMCSGYNVRNDPFAQTNVAPLFFNGFAGKMIEKITSVEVLLSNGNEKFPIGTKLIVKGVRANA